MNNMAGYSLRQSLEKSFLNRAQAVYFARLALYTTYLSMWLFSLLGQTIFPTTIFDLLLILLGFFMARLSYNNNDHQTIGRWGHFLTLIFDLSIHLFFTRTSGFLLSPLMMIHPLFSACFLLLFHNVLMLSVPLLTLPIAMVLSLIADMDSDRSNLLCLIILNLGLDTIMVFLINHPHGYEQKLAQEMLAVEKKLKELALLKERQRISREFHDGAGAKITSIIMQCEYLELMKHEQELTEIKESAQEAIDDMRRSIAFLNGDFDIVEQVELMLEKIRVRHRLATEASGIESLRELNPEQQIACCRIFQEGLTNALKHAKATLVRIEVKKHNNSVKIAINDNGIGFDLKVKQERGFGIKNMADRASQLGGCLSFGSKTTQGCQICFEIPLDTVFGSSAVKNS